MGCNNIQLLYNSCHVISNLCTILMGTFCPLSPCSVLPFGAACSWRTLPLLMSNHDHHALRPRRASAGHGGRGLAGQSPSPGNSYRCSVPALEEEGVCYYLNSEGLATAAAVQVGLVAVEGRDKDARSLVDTDMEVAAAVGEGMGVDTPGVGCLQSDPCLYGWCSVGPMPVGWVAEGAGLGPDWAGPAGVDVELVAAQTGCWCSPLAVGGTGVLLQLWGMVGPQPLGEVSPEGRG